MTHGLRLALILTGTVVSCGLPTAAVADEVFICDGNNVVRVALNKLDHMKRTNACVAAHYGLEIKGLPLKKAIEPAAVVDQLLSGPVPAKRPAAKPTAAKQQVVKRQGRLKKAAKVSSKDAKVVKKAPTKKTAQKKADLKRPVFPRDDALPVKEISAKPSDHRNVRVLNAKSKPTQWYRHVY